MVSRTSLASTWAPFVIAVIFPSSVQAKKARTERSSRQRSWLGIETVGSEQRYTYNNEDGDDDV